MGDLISTVELLNSNTAWPAKSLLTQLYAAVLDIEDRIGAQASRATSSIVTQSVSTIDGVARTTGNTVDEIRQLNLSLLRAPSIPVGSTVVFYTE